jgi:hypothetical protein
MLLFMQIQKRKTSLVGHADFPGNMQAPRILFDWKALASNFRLKFHNSGCASEGVAGNKHYFYVISKLFTFFRDTISSTNISYPP